MNERRTSCCESSHFWGGGEALLRVSFHGVVWGSARDAVRVGPKENPTGECLAVPTAVVEKESRTRVKCSKGVHVTCRCGTLSDCRFVVIRCAPFPSFQRPDW